MGECFSAHFFAFRPVNVPTCGYHCNFRRCPEVIQRSVSVRVQRCSLASPSHRLVATSPFVSLVPWVIGKPGTYMRVGGAGQQSRACCGRWWCRMSRPLPVGMYITVRRPLALRLFPTFLAASLVPLVLGGPGTHPQIGGLFLHARVGCGRWWYCLGRFHPRGP